METMPSTILLPRNVLEIILHASRSSHPREFVAMIRGEGNRIKELLLLPGTIQGDRFASVRLDMMPLDSDVIGVVHSHPSRNNHPSGADLNMFSKTGNVNLIVRYPYGGVEDIAAYDSVGNPREIYIVD